MDLETLRGIRRVLSAVVAASAIMLVMARVRTSPAVGADTTRIIASAVFVISLVGFILAWRKEHAAAEAGFAERERQQLAALRLQVELARRSAKKKSSSEEAAKNENGSPAKPNGKGLMPP